MAGRYWLGVDVGTTFTAAAVRRDGRTEVVQLGNRGAAIPSVLLLRDDGELLTGDTARRRAVSEPDRVATEFKRRVGDPVPVLVGGSPFAAETLVGRLLRWVVDVVTEREGSPPAGIGVTHPANWGPYKLDLLSNAIRTAGVDNVTFLSEPAAAARQYASQARVPDGAVVAVYDLGGGTFDACVLRKQHDGGFELLGQPEGIERLGGIDLDEAVLGHVQRSAEDLFAGIDADDPATRAALSRLRDDCTGAKEQLSADVDAIIPVLVPGHHSRDIRITRTEFESLVRPVLADTLGCVERSLRSAGVTADDLHAVLLVGGSSRVPLVGQLVAAGLGRPVAVDADPKLSVAQGAALAAEAASAGGAGDATTIVPVVPPQEPPPPEPPTGDEPAVPVPDSSRTVVGPRQRGPLVAAALLGIAALAAAFFLLRPDDDGDGDLGTLDDTSTTTAAPTTTVPPVADTPFVDLTGVEVEDGLFKVFFTPENFETSGDTLDGPNFHVHFFWNVDPAATSGDVRAQAGTNGVPEPCGCWFAYGGAAPARDENILSLAGQPDGATEICALVATPGDDPEGGHRIADVDADGAPDPDSGDCFDVSGMAEGDSRFD
jgi:actin-like ATPase involved in cell morphogenesis